jgi:hypothetical protein
VRPSHVVVAVLLLACECAAFYEVIVARLISGNTRSRIVIWKRERWGCCRGNLLHSSESATMIKKGCVWFR